MKIIVTELLQILKIDEFGQYRGGVNSKGSSSIKNKNQEFKFLFNTANVMFVTLLQFRMLMVSRFRENRNRVITRCDKF